jgi:hypothetical protein
MDSVLISSGHSTDSVPKEHRFLKERQNFLVNGQRPGWYESWPLATHS